MRNKAIVLLVVALFCLAQLVVLADKPAGVGPEKSFCVGNSHVYFEDGVKTKNPELFPGNGAPDVDREPPQKGERGIIGRAGNSNNAFVELWSKDPATWEILTDQGWGKLRYNVEGPEFEFHFTGHMLTAGTEYALIVYAPNLDADVWPGADGALLATGMANEYGDLLLKGSFDLGMDLDGAKIWLVYADDYSGGMTGWNPESYLFEYDLIAYTDTDA
ncbi:MAG: hypothetical protein J7M15_04655 [Anaerolineae bacterium]|nr:hypothetical protein [Anaerolineae bacterium]